MELTYFIPSVIGLAIVFIILFLGLFLGGTEEEEQERLEELTDRLRLYEHTGQRGFRVARLRRLPYEMHRAIRALEKSLRSLRASSPDPWPPAALFPAVHPRFRACLRQSGAAAFAAGRDHRPWKMEPSPKGSP